MDYISKLILCYLEAYKNIKAFHFVIYCPDRRVNVRESHWIDVADLPINLEWLWKRKVELAEQNYLHPIALSIGFMNDILVSGKRKDSQVKKYIPMIDFDCCENSKIGAPERILMTLEMLEMGRGIIVRSSKMNFGLAGYHYLGFDLWNKKKWMKFVKDGLFDEYGFSERKKLPMFPNMPYFAAKTIGGSWCRLVHEQQGTAFLRIDEKYGDSQPKVVEIFEGDTILSIEPPEYAPCMPKFREAERRWLESMEDNERYIMGGWPKGIGFASSPPLSDYCVPDCPLNGCSLECPATQVRLEGKQRRIEGYLEKKKTKQMQGNLPEMLSE